MHARLCIHHVIRGIYVRLRDPALTTNICMHAAATREVTMTGEEGVKMYNDSMAEVHLMMLLIPVCT